MAPSHPLSPSTASSAADRYADLVVAFTPGDGGAATADPRDALGPPGPASAGLGRAGCLIVAFTDGAIVNEPLDEAPDLRVHEVMEGFSESARLSVSADGVAWRLHGIVPGGTRDIDLSLLDVSRVRFLRFEDTGANVYSPSSPMSGYDLRGLEALHHEPAPAALTPPVQDTLVRVAPC